MPQLQDIINDLPASLTTDEDDGAVIDDTTLPDDGSDDGDGATADDEGADDATAADDDAADDDGTAADGKDNDDYVTTLEDDDKVETPPAGTPTDEGAFILQNLSKISVRVVVPGANGEDEVKTVEVYGYGDLPRNYKGFATKYEEGIFSQAVIAQEGAAQRLQTQFRQNKIQEDTQAYTRRENKAIAEDLTELRTEGIFPKFKGQPGTKEFNESEGAKEFDRVVAYMNAQNTKYGQAANSGKAFRHIGFREAYIMLNGPNPKAADKAEAQSRRAVAQRLTTGRGTKTGSRVVSTRPIQNLNDLTDEFAEFVGAGKAS